MRNIPHQLNVYERPLAGDKPLGSYQAYGYTHRILAVGGFDTAQCTLNLNPAEAEDFFLNNLGCRVSVIVDNPAEPCWEGFINRITLNAGSLSYSIGLDDMSNRAKVTYGTTGTTPSQTTEVNDTASQAVFGIKEGSIEGFALEGNITGRMEAIRDLYVAQKAWPQNTTAFNSGGGEYTIQVEMLGWYHVLLWVNYTNTSSSTSGTASAAIAAVLATYPNTSHIAVTTGLIESNSAFSLANRREQTGLTYWQYFQAIQEAGDGANRWVMGVTRTPYGGGSRRFYYRLADTSLKYTFKRDEGVINDKLGKRVRPWVVRPEGTARATDVFQGYTNQIRDDPRQFYIDAVVYDAEAQTVQLEGEDSIAYDALFNLRKYYLIQKQRFGVGKRRNR